MNFKRTGLLLAGLALSGAAAWRLVRPQSAPPSVPERRPVAVGLANRTLTASGFPSAPQSAAQTPSARGTLPYVLAATGRVDAAVRVAAGRRARV